MLGVMRMRKGSRVFYAGFGVGKVEDYYARNNKGRREGYVVINFPHLDLRTKLLLDSPVTLERLRPISSALEVSDALQVLASEPAHLPVTWGQRKAMLEGKLKSNDVREIAVVVRDLNGVPHWGYSPSHTDLTLLTRGRDILASELQVVYHLTWAETILLLQNTVRPLLVKAPRKRGRKPKDWVESEQVLVERHGLLFANV